MADYLSRLLDRTRGDVPILERRSAQPFEPSSPESALDVPSSASATIETHATDDSVGRRDLSPVLPVNQQPEVAHASRPAVHPRSIPAPAGAAELEPLAAPRAGQSRAERKPVLTNRADASESPSPVPNHDGTMGSKNPKRAAVPTTFVESVAFLASSPVRSSRPAPAHPQPVGVSRPADVTSTASVLGAGARRVVRITAAEMSLALPSRISEHDHSEAPYGPMPTAVFTPIPSVAVRPATAAPPPAIHVTIGRIEVRAIPDAAVPHPRSAGRAAPRLSLDAYLRLREGRAT
jgi:hypothetical protein